VPTARELLDQADALMRRNRTRQVDTEIPELNEAVGMPVIAPESSTAAVTLDDIPELTDAVEEIEIASIVEIPDDELHSQGWLRSGDEELAADIATGRAPSTARVPEPIGGRVLPLFAIAGKAHESTSAVSGAGTASAAEPTVAGTLTKAPVVELPVREAHDEGSAGAAKGEVAVESERPEAADAEGERVETAASALVEAPSQTRVGPAAPAANDWARWEALAEEIRMQVLQRVDIFTDTRLREQLSAHVRPIVERASAEMVQTINEEIGTLLRAYIAEAIEREIDKWREGNT
jgi:hypothetical protein